MPDSTDPASTVPDSTDASTSTSSVPDSTDPASTVPDSTNPADTSTTSSVPDSTDADDHELGARHDGCHHDQLGAGLDRSGDDSPVDGP